MKTPRKKLSDKLDKIIIDIVRVRDKWTCQKCFKKVEKHNAHCSHVIPRSRGNHLRWDLQNVKLLCFHCHINWWHKNPIEAGEWFKATFPDRWAYLEANKNKMTKYSIADLEELLVKLKGIYENTLLS